MDKFLLPLIATTTLVVIITEAYNYCNNEEKSLCNKGDEHFMCSLEKELEPYQGTTQFVSHIPETATFRKAFIDFHNEVRNQLAGGDAKTNSNQDFPTASRMREVIWDDELAYMARIHTKLVCFKHSKCHNTARLSVCGQNLGYMMPIKATGVKDVISTNMQNMFDEHKEVPDPDELADKFDGSKHLHCCGHFTVMVNDRVSRIGCAISFGDHCNPNNASRLCVFTTCHYDYSNMVNAYVYKTGDPQSACDDWDTGKSSKYDNLCASNGKIFLTNHSSMK